MEPRNKPLTNVDILRIAKAKRIPYFRGVYMRDALPTKPLVHESFIVNLDDSQSVGTHWVAVRKRGYNVMYYDSYGDLPPPLEIVKYLPRKSTIFYNYMREQRLPMECGHLALEFLLQRNPQRVNVFKVYK